MEWIIIIIAILIVLFLVYKKLFNNFVFIAKNITNNYLVLSEKYNENIQDENALLIAAGIINTASSIISGEFDERHIKYALMSARLNQCSVSSRHTVNISSENNVLLNMVSNESGLLLPFIMNMEALIMTSDSNMEKLDVLRAIVSSKKTINSSIVNATHKYNKNKRPKMAEFACDNFMNSNKAKSIRDKIFHHDFLSDLKK